MIRLVRVNGMAEGGGASTDDAGVLGPFCIIQGHVEAWVTIGSVMTPPSDA